MRELPVVAPPAAPPLFVATATEVTLSNGFYEEERDGADRFRWMQPSGHLAFAPCADVRFLEGWIFSEFRDLSQQLTCSVDGRTQTFPLVGGWAPLSIVVPAGAAEAALRLNKPFPPEYYPADRRTLGVRVRNLRLHADADRHAALTRQYENSRLNQQEVLGGGIVLTSTPPSLGIDLHGVCNVKPPCVYCEWDFNKTLEGERADVPFTRETLREWGAFFDNSATLINCSIGEPFMMRNLDDLLDIFGRTGKLLQMTTNGQILTDRNIQKLLGLPIDLYVSLDAATPQTYAKLRNNTFDRLVNNLRRLIASKGGRGRMPYVHMVFMPMRCNVHELDDFVRLAASLNADRVVLRPLNFSESVILDWTRAGYHFNYQQELLPFDELVRVSARACRLCRELGVELADQMDFGGSMRELFREDFDAGEPAAQPVSLPEPVPPDPAPAQVREVVPQAAEPTPPAAIPSLGGERTPACLEPWKSLYILRRGVLPCCYGGEPLAPMEDYRSAWNAPTMQAIRQALLNGRFHDYCLRSPACPIVRKSEQAGLLPMRQKLLMHVRHAWWNLNRVLRDKPNRFVYLPIKRTLIRIQRAATQPGYVGKHTRRLLGQWIGRD
jgi:MoaA/NifB/PqqE/SkfB family radical SAM enzyme